VGKAGKPETAEAEAALEHLCRVYWQPIFAHVRGLGYPWEDAQDLTQGFFARVLEKNYVRVASRDKGKFRSLLLVMLKRFLADQRRLNTRQKRGGGQPVLSLETEGPEFALRSEAVDTLTPEKLFERSWAHSLLERALDRLEEEMAASGRQQDFEGLKPLVIREREDSGAAVAHRLHRTAGSVKVAVHRLRRRLGELLREEIARTGATPEEVEEEIEELFWAFG
jgi:RNA polymerase sigma-70 factor (ECF subfamily)